MGHGPVRVGLRGQDRPLMRRREASRRTDYGFHGANGNSGDNLSMPYLFSYGTLQQESVQLASFGRTLMGRPDALPGWRRQMIEILDAEVFCLSRTRFHPILVPGESGDEITGMVFEVSEDELKRADAYEVADYKRIAARLKSGLDAFVYVKA